MSQSRESHIAGIILAGGGSRRLGRPKQLVKLPSGCTLLQHTISCFESAHLDAIVVTGAVRELVGKEIDPDRCTVVHNDKWEEGMASSIRCGIEEAVNRGATHVILSVVDQVHLHGELLREITEASLKHRDRIVTCRYGNGVLGPPTLFPKRYFGELKSLKGDVGAKSVMKRHQAMTIPFEGGEVDVDSVEDLS